MKSIISMLFVILLAGCSTFSSNYSCGSIPEAKCKSVSEVYDDTNVNVYDYRKELNQNGKNQINSSLKIEISESNKSIDYVMPGDPILTNPIIMRVLYNTHKNEQNDLDAGGYVYLRMKESEWLLQE